MAAAAAVLNEDADVVLFADDEGGQTSGGESENCSFELQHIRRRSSTSTSGSSAALSSSGAVSLSSGSGAARVGALIERGGVSVAANGGSKPSNSSSGRSNKLREQRQQQRRRRAARDRVYRRRRGGGDRERRQWIPRNPQGPAGGGGGGHKLRRDVIRGGGPGPQLPLAPYNTTQFLMNDHELEYGSELDAQLRQLPSRACHRHRDASMSMDDDDDGNGFYYSSPSDEEDFVNEDFAKQYGYFTAERLSVMSKADLVLECMELNRRVELLEDKVGDIRKGEIPMSREEAEKINVIQSEIAALDAENERMRRSLHEICVARREDRHRLRLVVGKETAKEEVEGDEVNGDIDDARHEHRHHHHMHRLGHHEHRRPALSSSSVSRTLIEAALAEKASVASNSDSGVESNYAEEIVVELQR